MPRVDPVGVLLMAASTVVFLLHGFEGRLTRDVAVYAYAGQQVAEGVPPYENILNRAGPLAHLVPGAGAFLGRALGADDLIAMRVTLMLVSVLAVGAAYAAGRNLYRSRAMGAVAAATLLSFQGFITYATAGPREKTTTVLFILLTLAALARRRWVAAGATTALATLTWQGSFFPLAAGALVAAVLLPEGRQRVSALLRWAAAGAAVTAGFVGYFAVAGALPEFWEGFVVVNAGWTDQHGLLTTLAETRRVTHGFGWSVVLLVLGLAGTLVVAAARMRRLDRDDAADVAGVAVAVGAVVTVLWSLRAFEGWPDALVALPFAACGVAGLVDLLLRRLPQTATRAVTTGLVCAAVLVAGTWAAGDRDPVLEQQRRQVTQPLSVLPGDVDLLAIGSPEPLVLGRLRNPIRYQLFTGGQAEYLDDTYPGGLARLAEEIEQLQPTVITVRGVRNTQWLLEVLQRDYQRVGGHRTSYLWFASRRRTTEEQRRAMKQAIRDAEGARHDTGRRVRSSDVRTSLP